MQKLTGSAYIVTGASKGFGLAISEALLAAGAKVGMIARNEATLQEAVRELGGERALGLAADVADGAQIAAAFAQVKERFGRLDGLVNNAGATKFCDHNDLDGLDKQDFLRIYGVNAVGPYQMARAAAPLMRRGGCGGIVNVASIAGLMGIGSSIAYAASKGALITLGLSLARVLGPEIRVNTVCPGFIDGDWLAAGMGQERYDRTKAHLQRNTPLRMTVTADIVAEAIVHFLSGAAGVTGETLILDGGHHLQQMPFARR